MAIVIPRTSAASAPTLATLAEKYGDLPTDYIDFLAVHDGATPSSNMLEGTHCSIGISTFIYASDIIKTANSVEGLSGDLLPFGKDDSGNLLCLGTKDHHIYFWDHEIDDDKVVAASFDEFIKRLKPLDMSSAKVDIGQVRRVWINPEFKPEF